MSKPELPAELMPLLSRLVDQTISDDDFARLETILAESAQARAMYRRYMNLHAALPALLGDSPRLMFRGAEQQPDELVDWDTDSREGYLRLLRKLDAEDGEVAIVDLDELRQQEAQGKLAQRDRAEAIDLRELPIVVGYVLHKALTSRFAAIAAALVLAAVLLGVYGLRAGQSPATTAQTPGQRDVDDMQAPGPKVVATLTRQDGAQWGGAALSVGEPISPGQRLTLTHGLAEITTSRGARAIIQAPCTIELLDSDNAIRLHAGKLVGICETMSSKGFLVRTAHLDITDLGTRFGVDATDPGSTQVHVMEGEVSAVRATARGLSSSPQTLTQDEALIAHADRDELVRIDSAPERFASLLLRKIPLPGTGHGLSIGETDPNWQVVAVNGQTLETPVLMKVGNALLIGEGGAQLVSDTALWLSDSTHYPNRTDPETKLTCRTTIEVPADADPTQAVLALTFGADDRIVQIRINGQPFTPPENQWTGTNAASTAMRIDGALLTGANTVEFDIIDVARQGNTLWGFGVQWHLEINTRQAP